MSNALTRFFTIYKTFNNTMIRFSLLIAGFVFCSATNAMAASCNKLPPNYSVSSPMSVAEIEADNMKDMGEKLKVRPDMPKVPFGFINRDWEGFKSRIEKGDTLVHFSSDERSWRSLAGEEGFAIMRKGCILATFVTMVS